MSVTSEELECGRKEKEVILCDLDVAPGKAALTVNIRREEKASCRNPQKKIRQFTTARHCF
jgi:hypothetical protein